MQIKSLTTNWQSISRLLVIFVLTGCANANVISPPGQLEDKQQIITSQIECGDFLRRFGTAPVPDSIEFIDCSQEPGGQALKSANYKVKGTGAGQVEEFLQREYSIGRLQFICCGWGPDGGAHGSFFSNGHQFTVIMHSWDTVVNDRAAWGEIDFFYVEVVLADV